MKKSNRSDPSQELANAPESARARLVAAENSVRTAKHESKVAKRKRKEAKEAARLAKKRLKRAKEELSEARRVVAEAEEKHSRQVAAAAKAKKRRRLRAIKGTGPKAKPQKENVPSAVEPAPQNPDFQVGIETPSEPASEFPAAS